MLDEPDCPCADHEDARHAATWHLPDDGPSLDAWDAAFPGVPDDAQLAEAAFVAAIAYVDPGNVAANVSAGAQLGYLLVWVIVVANAMAVLVQYLSAKLGLVTGRSLPEVLAERMGRRARLAYWGQAELVAERLGQEAQRERAAERGERTRERPEERRARDALQVGTADVVHRDLRDTGLPVLGERRAVSRP